MKTNIHNLLIFTPTPQIAQVIVGRLSSLFLIHLPAPAAMLRRFLFMAGAINRVCGVIMGKNTHLCAVKMQG